MRGAARANGDADDYAEDEARVLGGGVKCKMRRVMGGGLRWRLLFLMAVNHVTGPHPACSQTGLLPDWKQM